MPGPDAFGEIFFDNHELTQIVSQVFFEMDSYVMILRKNRGDSQKFICGDPVPQAHAPASVFVRESVSLSVISLLIILRKIAWAQQIRSISM